VQSRVENSTNLKKIFGYIFIILAAILSFAIVGQLYKIFVTIAGVFQIVSGNLTSYQTGRIIGELSIWIGMFIAVFLLWKYGFKWVKHNKSDHRNKPKEI